MKYKKFKKNIKKYQKIPYVYIEYDKKYKYKFPYFHYII